jgi:adenine deaminase
MPGRRDYADMAVAANRLSEIAAASSWREDGKVLAELALPVAGLMSRAALRGGAR